MPSITLLQQARSRGVLWMFFKDYPGLKTRARDDMKSVFSASQQQFNAIFFNV